MSIKGVAFVTGGNRGIGQAIAQRLSIQGYKVAITYRENKSNDDRISIAWNIKIL